MGIGEKQRLFMFTAIIYFGCYSGISGSSRTFGIPNWLSRGLGKLWVDLIEGLKVCCRYRKFRYLNCGRNNIWAVIV